MLMIDRDPFRTPSGRPIIAHIGEVVEKRNIIYLQLAAEELNERYGLERYTVEVPTAAEFGPQGTKLPGNLTMLKIAGAWAT